MTTKSLIPRDNRDLCTSCGSQLPPKPFGERTDDGALFHLAKCRSCHLIFVTDPVSEGYQRTLARPVGDMAANVKRYKFRLGHYYLAAGLATLIRRRAGTVRLLDVGCGTGELGVMLAKHNLEGLVYQGIEPITDRAMLAQQRGLNVQSIRMEDLISHSINLAKWDVIVLDNVLEHLLEPADAIRGLRTLLHPGGAIVIAVPNVYDVRRYANRSFPLWIPFVHINYFSIRTLRLVCVRNGLAPQYLQPSLRGLPARTKLTWGMKALAERWFNLPPRGLYVAAIDDARS